MALTPMLERPTVRQEAERRIGSRQTHEHNIGVGKGSMGSQDKVVRGSDAPLGNFPERCSHCKRKRSRRYTTAQRRRLKEQVGGRAKKRRKRYTSVYARVCIAARKRLAAKVERLSRAEKHGGCQPACHLTQTQSRSGRTKAGTPEGRRITTHDEPGEGKHGYSTPRAMERTTRD